MNGVVSEALACSRHGVSSLEMEGLDKSDRTINLERVWPSVSRPATSWVAFGSESAVLG